MGMEHDAAEEQRQRRLAALRELADNRLGDESGGNETGETGTPSPKRRAWGGIVATVATGVVLLAVIAGVVVALNPGLLPGRTSRQPGTTPTPSTAVTRPGLTADYTLAGGGPCVTLGRHPTATAANTQVTSDGYVAHSEPELAEDPANPLELVGGSKYFTDPAHYGFQIGYAYSRDGGCTWQDGGVLPGFGGKGLVSDITFAYGPDERAYASVLFTGRGNSPESGLAVLTSTDGGATFGQPVILYDDPTGAIFSDKPWITVDDTKGPGHGNVYLVWSYDHGDGCGQGNPCFEEVGFSRSTDGGTTFSAPKLIEGNAAVCTNAVPGRAATSTQCDAAIGATPVIEPNGALAVAFAYQDILAGAPSHTFIPTKMLVTTSADGGATWSAPVNAATIHDTPGTLRPDHFRNFSLPAFAADPSSAGALYLAWADESGQQAEIVLAGSRDGGRTWSAPARVNDNAPGDGANHAQPALAVAPNGVISVSFFDTRNDAQHRLLDVYLAQSTDHGATFLPNVRVTPESMDPGVGAPTDPSGLQFFGDYQGLVADNLFVHPLWNDTRTGAQQLFTAAVPSAQS
jgi:hypothetical protein